MGTGGLIGAGVLQSMVVWYSELRINGKGWEVVDVKTREYTLELVRDDDTVDPRELYDHVGTLALFHRRYRLGDLEHGIDTDDYDGWAEMRSDLESRGMLGITPVYMLDHSGITISTRPFNDPWDSGQVGFGFIDPVHLDTFGCKPADADEIVAGEVEEYDRYLTGDVWGVVIRDDEGNEVESCWGFYGRKHAELEGAAMLDAWK